jgi:Bacteriophage Lambda NinG protein
MKLRACKDCKEHYEPVRAMSPRCIPCAIKKGRNKTLKDAAKVLKAQAVRDRLAVKARKDALEPLQHFLKAAEKAVNTWIRHRDRELPCISCDTYDALEWHAGHFISVGASSSLRYDESNIAKQCQQCNWFGAGKATEFEKRLRCRIGDAEVERLKNAPRSKDWTRDELKTIKALYAAKLREMK